METSSRKRSVTLQDVAQRVGVTPMTVSRALNGGQVSSEVRDSVSQVVKELCYRPHLGARHMKSGKSAFWFAIIRAPKTTRPRRALWLTSLFWAFPKVWKKLVT